MARPLKDGVDYFPKDTDFYADDKVRLLRAEFGSKGMYLLDYILCDLYGKNGYFIKWDKNKCYLVSDGAGCGCSPEFVAEFISGCVRCSFFDERVFDLFGVLTSAGIQRRFIRMLNSRENFTFVEEYFLLDTSDKKDVPQGILNKLAFKKVSDKENEVKSKENPNKTKDNSQSKIEQNKVDKSRVEDLLHPTPELQKVLDVYNANMPPITGIILHSIDDYLKEVEADVIIYAITEAVKHSVRTWSYVETIINSNIAAGRVTLASVKEYAKKYRNNKSGLGVYDDKNLNYDELEQIMQSKM